MAIPASFATLSRGLPALIEVRAARKDRAGQSSVAN
jgi:hypothetical protein